jgi:hypothetical protein
MHIRDLKIKPEINHMIAMCLITIWRIKNYYKKRLLQLQMNLVIISIDGNRKTWNVISVQFEE